MSKLMTEGSPAEALLKGIGEKPKAGKTKKPARAKTEAQPKQNKTYRINLALTPDLGEELKARAEAEDRSVNKFIEIILKDYLSK